MSAFALFLLPGLRAQAASNWQTLSNCVLVANASNDGDSFHVRCGDREYIFRLYFVDTPECDYAFPERVSEQAAYWNITTDQAIQLGKTAARFTASQLKTPFTIVTRWQDALGRSKMRRHYAFVLVNDKDLAELLTEKGLARRHGTTVDRPNGPSQKEETRRLARLEQVAKAARQGGWALAAKPAAPKPGRVPGPPLTSLGVPTSN